MINRLEEICSRQQIHKILLDVRESNTEARVFYEKHAFREDGIRQEFYENPKEDAVLMSRDLVDAK